jgi:superfamily I DNA/RNA helicase
MACKVFPKLTDYYLDALSSKAEAKFYRACAEQLPSNFLVIHSVSLISNHDRFGPQIGECDFVIFDPLKGMFVVEVKGGGVSHDPQNGPDWYSIDRFGTRHQIKDPFKQSENYRFKMLKQIKDNVRGLKSSQIPVGHSVAFPDISIKSLGGIVSHNRPKEIIACSEDLKDLNAWYQKSSNFWMKHDGFEPIGKQSVKEIERVFLGPVDASASLRTSIEQEEETRIRLTDDQSRLLLCVSSHTRFNVIGGAGTGKTVLARKLTEQLASQGKSVALICYNRALGVTNELYFGDASYVNAGTFHAFFERLFRNSLDEYLIEAASSYPDEDEWRVKKPFAYALALEEQAELRFDAVIVDEAQDFSAEMWMPIQMLLKTDTNQALYSTVDHVPALSPPFLLYTNCRNTKEIHARAYERYSGPPISPPSLSGEDIQTFDEGLFSDQLQKIEEILHSLLKTQDLDPNDIVILVAKSSHLDAYFEALAEQTHKYRFIKDEFGDSGEVRVSTVRRFKGLEATTVILWGLEEVEEAFSGEISYVGTSRAKSLCYIVG